ncbi:MAG: glycosyltransferase [Bacteroidetes bacterium]|nr:glycosyltransferase [Bacteroidota bacterium]
MIFLIACVVLPFLIIQILSLWMIDRPPVHKPEEFAELPVVSILLAARNEEKLIIRSLKAISELDYPSEKLQVCIGNDGSTDRTAELIEEFISGKANFELHHINGVLGKGRGKANVLAHLAHKAKGEFYFITDVDVRLPKDWIRELLAECEVGVGIVSGTTTCDRGNSVFGLMQSIDWLHFMGYIQSFANMNVACTSVGNNMAVRADAYKETGGFEEIDFSITEDYKLFEAVTEKGWGWRTILTPGSLGLATHIDSWKEMLHQRKRWLIGAKDLPLNWKLMIVLYGLFIPALILLFILKPWIALDLWIVKFCLQSLYIRRLCRLSGLKPFNILELLIYEIYVLINTAFTAIFYFLPVSAVWKGRIYSENDLK